MKHITFHDTVSRSISIRITVLVFCIWLDLRVSSKVECFAQIYHRCSENSESRQLDAATGVFSITPSRCLLASPDADSNVFLIDAYSCFAQPFAPNLLFDGNFRCSSACDI